MYQPSYINYLFKHTKKAHEKPKIFNKKRCPKIQRKKGSGKMQKIKTECYHINLDVDKVIVIDARLVCGCLTGDFRLTLFYRYFYIF